MEEALARSMGAIGYAPAPGPSGGWSFERGRGGDVESVLVSPARGRAEKAVDNDIVTGCPAPFSFDEVAAVASALPEAGGGLSSLGYKAMRALGGAGWTMPRFEAASGDDSWQVDIDPSCRQVRMYASGPGFFMRPCAMRLDVLAGVAWELRSRGWA